MEKDPNFVNNKFIENLTFDESKDPITGKPYSYIKLDLDMLNIKSDSENCIPRIFNGIFRFKELY